MAASAWILYDRAKHKIGNGTINLNSGIYRMALHTSASNASTKTLSLWTSVNNQAAGGGYARKTLASVVWTVGATTTQYKWDAADPVFTASGSAIVNAKFAVITNSLSAGGGHAMAWSKLSTGQFTVATGNTLTVQIDASGIFTLA